VIGGIFEPWVDDFPSVGNHHEGAGEHDRQSEQVEHVLPHLCDGEQHGRSEDDYRESPEQVPDVARHIGEDTGEGVGDSAPFFLASGAESRAEDAGGASLCGAGMELGLTADAGIPSAVLPGIHDAVGGEFGSSHRSFLS
jgi:hypothetical protein